MEGNEVVDSFLHIELCPGKLVLRLKWFNKYKQNSKADLISLSAEHKTVRYFNHWDIMTGNQLELYKYSNKTFKPPFFGHSV